MNSKELRYHIENGKIENIYLFSGPEVGEKNEVIQLIEKKLFPDQDPFKYYFYCGKDFNNIEFINTVNSQLLFSDKKIIFLKNIEDVSSATIKILEEYIIPLKIENNKFEKNILNKIKKEDIKKHIIDCYLKEQNYFRLKENLSVNNKKKLIEILHSLNSQGHDNDTYLIMLNESNEKIPNALLNLLLPDQNIIFWEMFENQKKEWIRDQFKKKNLYIKEDAISFILDMIENNKAQLSSEIEKITSLVKTNKEKVINLTIIEEYLYHSKVETPFSLYSSMLSKNLTKAIDILDNLFITDQFNLLNGIIWSHRRFLKAIDLYENHNMPLQEIFNNLKISTMRDKEDFKKGLNNFNYIHISLMFYYLSELDYYLKILPDNLQLVKLQEFIINFINGDIQKSFLQGSFQFLHY